MCWLAAGLRHRAWDDPALLAGYNLELNWRIRREYNWVDDKIRLANHALEMQL